MPGIPPAWIDQLAPGGRVVTDLRGEMSSSLAVLDKTGPDTVAGPLLEQPGHFMWLRPDPDNPLRDINRFDFVVDLDTAETTTTDLDPQILDEPGLRVLLSILEPTLSTPSRSKRNGADTRWMHAHRGCWVEIVDHKVTQGGPRHLWPAIEHAATEWHRLGQPGRGRYGLTARTDGTHRYWVDQPDQPIRCAPGVVCRPQLIHKDPIVRETVSLLRQARREAGGRELRGQAWRMGIRPPQVGLVRCASQVLGTPRAWRISTASSTAPSVLCVRNLDAWTECISFFVGAKTDSRGHEELTLDIAGKIAGATVVGSFVTGLET